MKTGLVFFFVLIAINIFGQTTTFGTDGKSTGIMKDSSVTERNVTRLMTRKGVSDKPVTREELENAVYIYNGNRVTMAEVDSITKNWEVVKSIDDISKRPVERTIMAFTKEEVSKLRAEQKTEAGRNWNNKRIPDYSFTDINGKMYSNQSLKGKIVVFNFWFIACGPCRKEMPELNKLVEKYKNNIDVVFLGLAEDSDDAIREFLKKKEFNFNLIGKASKFSRGTMGITSWPTSMVVDKNGVVQFSLTGNDEKELQELDKKIEELSR